MFLGKFALKVYRWQQFLIQQRIKRKGLKDLPSVELRPDSASQDLYSLLSSPRPCMIARYGSTELLCIISYLSATMCGKWTFTAPRRWWNDGVIRQMQQWSGFFPATVEKLERFSQLMLADSREVDYLGSWRRDEVYLRPYFNSGMRSTLLRYLEPFWCEHPWTRALEGKKVLVVHPFAETIERQYKERREHLFENPEVLPQFQLETIKAVQSLGGESNEFADWFDALHWMEQEIDNRDYDICLIGCGAYGFPLAAHVKRMGKKAVHLGGALQLLFGIKGRRWENPMYGVREWGIPEGSYSRLMNEYWVRPDEHDKPQTAQQVENGCYW